MGEQELETKLKEVETELSESAPAWVVTFGDLMSLLLCFFVLLLSFSNMDKQKFKEMAGAMEKAFGVQRKETVFAPPTGMKMIFRDFDQAIVPPQPKEEFIVTQKKDVDDVDPSDKNLAQEMSALQKAIEKALQELFDTDARFEEIRDLVEVEKIDKNLVIRMIGDCAFEEGSAKISSLALPAILAIGNILKKVKGNIFISGHTDINPPNTKYFKTNHELSVMRAMAVSNLFIAQGCVDPQGIATLGFGEYRPIAPNITKDGRKRNRRVEIVFSNFNYTFYERKQLFDVSEVIDKPGMWGVE